MVPRLWLAMEPIQVAASASNGKSAKMSAWLRMSVNVAPPPMTMDPGRLAMNRRSGMPQRLTIFDAGRRPAACATINSVPPAIGVHCPGSPAINASTAARLPGATIACASASLRMQVLFGSGGNYGFEYADESRAATEIAGKAFTDFGHRGVGIALQQVGRGHQHAGRADAALRAAAGQKCPLQRVHFSVAGQTLDGFDACALTLQHRNQATVYKLAIHAHCARAALAFTAAFLGSGQVQVFAQHIQQALQWRDAYFPLHTIHRDAYRGPGRAHTFAGSSTPSALA